MHVQFTSKIQMPLTPRCTKFASSAKISRARNSFPNGIAILSHGFLGLSPEPRTGHSISLLSGGRLVVCGGKGDVSRSCIGWQSGNTSWTHLHTLRSSFLIYYSNKQLTQQHGQSFQCGLDTIIFSQRHCTIWLAQCRNFARFENWSSFFLLWYRWRNISTASQWI